jgi:hypothetical protein
MNPQENKIIALPGINSVTVQLAGLQHVDAAMALQLTGIDASGLLIPYRTIDGVDVVDGSRPFYRLRLDHPRGSQKYHQRAGSSPHAYIPPHNMTSDQFKEIVLVEGEKKALALSEAGKTAFGISGFYGGATRTDDGRWVPVPELEEIKRICSPETIYFAGDQDTLFNGQFYDAAIKLREAFPNARLYCLQVPANAPGKGFDDCRAVMEPAAFAAMLQQAEAKALRIEVTDKSSVGSLALTSLREERSEMIAAFKKASPEQQTALRDNLLKLTVSLRMFKCDLDAEEVIKLAEAECGYGRRAFNAEVKNRLQAAQREARRDLGTGNSTSIIKTEHQGVWAAQAAEVLGQMLYWHGRKFADVTNGDIVHFDASTIATYLDNPDRCQFFRLNREGLQDPVALTANDAEYIESVPTHRPELIRPIEIVATTPVLIWRPPGYELITGYDRESRVYCSGSLPALPSVEEAKARLLKLIGDFNFSNDYEKARCLAILLTPAVVRSGALGQGRCPFFYVSKDQKGAGGGYIVKLVAAVYGMRPGAVVPQEKNPEKSKEGVSLYLAKGNHLVYLDNVRGDVLKQMAYLESLLTEPHFEARAPYMQALVDVRREVFACTSNGAVMSEDLADRTLEIRIIRQPQGYVFHDWPEGDLLAHVEANRAEILAAIYALVQCYDEAAKKTHIPRRSFRFREWEQALSWLIHEHFPELPGLLEPDYCDRKKVELTDPNYGTLLEILRVAASVSPGTPTPTIQLVELAQERKIPLKGVNPVMELGKLMKRHFPHNGQYEFAGRFKIVRSERPTVTSNGNPVNFYTVTFLRPPESSGSSKTETGPTTTTSTAEPPQDSASFTTGGMGGQKLVISVGSVEPQLSTLMGSNQLTPQMPTTPFNAAQPSSSTASTPVLHQRSGPPPLPPRSAPRTPEAPNGWSMQSATPIAEPVRRPPPLPPQQA